MGNGGTVLVVSAHAGDFVWRAGGAIAAATARGDRAVVVCLSYGERGESASQWLAGKTLDEIKALRRGRPRPPQRPSGRKSNSSTPATTRSCRAGNCSISSCASTAGCSPPSC